MASFMKSNKIPYYVALIIALIFFAYGIFSGLLH